jgi:hypothetical protein
VDDRPFIRSAPFAEAVKMGQTGDVTEGSEENYHLAANDVGPFNDHIDWTLPKAPDNDLQKANEKLQAKLINEDLAKNAMASTPGPGISLPGTNQTEIIANRELAKIRDELKVGKLDQNNNLFRNNQVAIVPTKELPILDTPNAKLSFLIPEHPVVLNPELTNPLNIRNPNLPLVPASNFLNPNTALLTKPGTIIQSASGLSNFQDRLINNQAINSDGLISNRQIGHKLAAEFPPQMLSRPEQNIEQDRLIEQLRNDIIQTELAKKREPLIGLTSPKSKISDTVKLAPQPAPPNLFIPDLKPQFKPALIPAVVQTTAHPLERFMNDVVDTMHQQEDDERERRKKLSALDEMKKIQESYKVEDEKNLQARNSYRTSLNKIQGLEGSIVSSRLGDILLTTERPLLVSEDQFLKDSLMKQFGRAALNSLNDNIEDANIRNSLLKTANLDTKEKIANASPTLLDLVMKSKIDEEIKNKNDLKTKDILRQLVITNSSSPPITEKIPRILDSKIKTAEQMNLDLKKKVLSEQLSKLRMLSNATNQMTERVNKVLLKRMSKTIDKRMSKTADDKNKFEKLRKTSSNQGGGRVINWNIENQGKQTIIIL